MSDIVTDKPKHTLDITGEFCPLTFVKTKLLIEKINSGDSLEVRLKGAEPLRNVPRSVRELGHVILSLTPEPGEGPDGIHRLLLRKCD
ncbi:MAG TPA: sulfurtransferase TusA family protein [Candidatus Sulfotelmatobacter sp.]|nr:sulfurtransferase TusA family protein [Candidatus Sulfotelmatobacter sp.]